MQFSGQKLHMPKNKPDFTREDKFNGIICGVDEAGRGPLAGPVVAAAVILAPDSIPDGLNDSKLLSPEQRELLLNEIARSAQVGIGIAEPEEIDRANILGASMAAMRRAVMALPQNPDKALIDGNKVPDIACEAEAIIKGDSKSLSIAAASIVAKVTRDRLMQEAETRFSGYELAKHKGYPTQLHLSKLAELGPCPIHRFDYKPVKLLRSN